MSDSYNSRGMLYNARAQTGLLRQSNRIQAAQLALEIAQYKMIDEHFTQLHGEMGEQTEALRGIDRAIRRQTRLLHEDNVRMIDAIDEQTAVLERTGEVAADQRFAQWRDGSPVGQKYYYEYRPRALAYLESYRRMSELWRAQVLLTVRRRLGDFNSWRDPGWLPDAPDTGRFLPMPERQSPPGAEREDLSQLPEPAEPAGASTELKVVYYCALVFTALLGLPALTAMNLPGLIVAIPPGLISWWLHTKVQAPEQAHRQWEEQSRQVTAENRRRAELAALVERDQLEQRRWETENERCRHRMTILICEYLGLDLGTDWSEDWATGDERERHARITETVANEREKPPSLYDFHEPGTLALDMSMIDRLLRPMQSFRAQQIRVLDHAD